MIEIEMSAELKKFTSSVIQRWAPASTHRFVGELVGGRSGARILLVDIKPPAAEPARRKLRHGTSLSGEYILKLDAIHRWPTKPNKGPDNEAVHLEEREDKHHKDVLRFAPSFRKHVVNLVHSRSIKDKLAVLYQVAGLSQLNRLVTLDRLDDPPIWHQTCELLSLSLLEEFNQGYEIDQNASASQTMSDWLGHRLDFKGPSGKRLYSFAMDVTKGKPWVHLGNLALACPLWVCLHEALKSDSRPTRICGMIHGDLHSRNILRDKRQSAADMFWVIDFAQAAKAPLFFDHAYFELSLILDSIGGDAERLEQLLHALSFSQDDPAGNKVKTVDSPLLDCIRGIRSGIERWQKSFEPNRASVVEGQLLLARVAAGLNWANKPLDSEESRVRAFEYAAWAATEYLTQWHSELWQSTRNALGSSTKRADFSLGSSRSTTGGDPAESGASVGPRLLRGRLPTPADTRLFIGRDKLISDLNRWYLSGAVHVVQLVSDGGVGKSTVAWHWIERLQERGYAGRTAQVMEWSFYSQGHHDYATDSQNFLSEAARHFGLTALVEDKKTPIAADRLGVAIAEAFLKEGGIIVLDGVEPLQHPQNVQGGGLKDPGLLAFINKVRVASPSGAAGPPRMLLITTRWKLPELPARPRGSIRQVDLIRLSDEDGAKLLKSFRLPNSPNRGLYFRVGGDTDAARTVEAEFRAASHDFDGHALALLLLASYLLSQHNGDLAMRRHVLAIPSNQDDGKYHYARRVIRSYERMFEEASSSSGDDAKLARACRQVLGIVGLFDRPAPAELVAMLRRRSPPIFGLTDAVTDDACFAAAVERLSDLRLLTSASAGGEVQIDAHPLVREHFGVVMRREQPTVWREAHSRLYEYLRDKGGIPETVEELDPLLQAIMHGCKAGRYDDALHEIYFPRVMRGKRRYAAEQLGALGPLVSVLSHFFEPGKWGDLVQPIDGCQTIRDSDKLTILIESSVFLTVTRGYAAPEVKDTCEAAVLLCRELKDVVAEMRAQYGLWRYYLVSGNLSKAISLASEIRRIRDANPSLGEEHELVMQRVYCTTSFYTGRFEDAIRHGNEGVKVFQRIVSKNPTGQVDAHTHELGMVCLSHAALALWHVGKPSEAVAQSRESLSYSGDAGRAHSHAMSLFCDTILQRMQRNDEQTTADAAELTAICTRHGLSFWLLAGAIMDGRAQAEHGLRENLEASVRDGLREMYRSFELWNLSGAELVNPFWLAQIAEIHLLMARQWPSRRLAQAGVETVEKGLKLVQKNGEKWWLPELHRLDGELYLLAGGNAVTAMLRLGKAFETALEIDSKSLQLRIAVGMSRLYGRSASAASASDRTNLPFISGLPQEAGTNVRSLLEWCCKQFSSNLITADLNEARLLLAT